MSSAGISTILSRWNVPKQVEAAASATSQGINTEQKVVPENAFQISERQELPRPQVQRLPHQHHSISEKRILISNSE